MSGTVRQVEPLVSIIVRTKNEERWIGHCLDAINNQEYQNYEIILVDNNSDDSTVSKSQNFGVDRVITIDDFFPGKAINLGIEASSGDYIVCLSGHCVPTNRQWLGSLVGALKSDSELGAVYGRQEPFSFSRPSDKRDLLLVFGRDPIKQWKDNFFHNANSIFRREIWHEIRFDDKVTNIEDRLWAQELLKSGWAIGYEPNASVYHYHGIHHDGDSMRCKQIIDIIEKFDASVSFPDDSRIKYDVAAIIPVQGPLDEAGSEALRLTVGQAKQSSLVKRVFVSTPCPSVAQTAREAGAEVPHLRPDMLSGPAVSTDLVIEYELNQIATKLNYHPDIILYAEIKYPGRADGFFDTLISRLTAEQCDTVIAAYNETDGGVWASKHGEGYQRLDSGENPKIYKESLLISVKGVGLVVFSDIVRSKKLIGTNVFLHELIDKRCFISY